jgi:hypothetical protein
MSLQTLKRTFLFTLLLLAAQSLLAGHPSARYGSRAAFNEVTGTAFMFGGGVPLDTATSQAYELAETWEWVDSRFIRRYPAHNPPARVGHAMVYDSKRERIVMFGGRTSTGELADTWYHKDGDWHQIETADAPSGRDLAGVAYDRDRDRILLYGGMRLSDDKRSFVQFTDLWEFDGTNWTRIFENGPTTRKPIMAFDESRKQVIMLGHNDLFETSMFRYDADARAFVSVTAETLPCANDASLAYADDAEKVLLIGGACLSTDPAKISPSTDRVWAWDGTNWSEMTFTTAVARGINQAVAYDRANDQLVVFGGSFAFSTVPHSSNYVFLHTVPDFVVMNDVSSPSPRSLFGMATDTINNTIWLLNGITDAGVEGDFWKFDQGLWSRVEVEGTPSCGSPSMAFDTDRARLVVFCPNSDTFEWDGTAWKAFADLRTKPGIHRFAMMVYDQNIRKTVFYGGYDEQGGYYDKTWTWDGTTWAEVAKKKKAPGRSLAAMWYDPTLRRTVVFGGVGRRSFNSRIERYGDMWSFDGTNWTEMKPSTLPGTRYGAQVAVNPITNRTILFGGIRVDTIDEKKKIQKQVYADDTWEWDGSTWRQLQTDATPGPRENAGMAFDPQRNWIIITGGWSGYFHSDTWRFVEGRWIPFAEGVITSPSHDRNGGRRRPARHSGN